MKAHNSIVWLDHREARIFGIDAEKLQAENVVASDHHFHRHPKGPGAEHEHPSDAAHFFKDLAAALRDAGAVLLVGPSTAKLQFLRFLAKHEPALEAKVVGVETVDHPSDRQLVAQARHYFDPEHYPRA
jgi:stalled ribosome rescue protein Dom34